MSDSTERPPAEGTPPATPQQTEPLPDDDADDDAWRVPPYGSPVKVDVGTPSPTQDVADGQLLATPEIPLFTMTPPAGNVVTAGVFNPSNTDIGYRAPGGRIQLGDGRHEWYRRCRLVAVVVR